MDNNNKTFSSSSIAKYSIIPFEVLLCMRSLLVFTLIKACYTCMINYNLFQMSFQY